MKTIRKQLTGLTLAAFSAAAAMTGNAAAQDSPPLNGFAQDLLDQAQQCVRHNTNLRVCAAPLQRRLADCRDELPRTIALSRAENSAERLTGKIEACGSYIPALTYLNERQPDNNLAYVIKRYNEDTQEMLTTLTAELSRNAQLSEDYMQRPDDRRPYAAISAAGSADSQYRVATGPSKNAAELKAVEQCRLAFKFNNCRWNVASAPLDADGYFVVSTTPYHPQGIMGDVVQVAYTSKETLAHFLEQNKVFSGRYTVLPVQSYR